MTEKLYYLFGEEAVQSYWEGEPIGDEYAVYCYDPSKDHPSDLLDASQGWGDWCEIKEEVYVELYARKEVSNG